MNIEEPFVKQGPRLPIEFARKSGEGTNNRRLTLVLVESVSLVPTRYAIMKTLDLKAACENLRERERTSLKKVGYVNLATDDYRTRLDSVLRSVKEWAKPKGLLGVIWTDLEPTPELNPASVGEDLRFGRALDFLQSLDEEEQRKAFDYIEQAPREVQTSLRIRLTKELGLDPSKAS